MSYAREKLALAVAALAESATPIQRRLASAGLTLVMLDADDFEDSSDREKFEAIRAAFQAVEPSGGEGRIEASSAQMSDEEAEKVARQIVALDGSLRPLI